MNRNIIIAVVVVVIIAVIAGFFLLSPKTNIIKDKGALNPSPTSTSNGAFAAVANLTIEASEYQFSPRTFAGVAGKPVKITVKNSGKMAHDFSIKDLDVKTKMLQPGQSETITVVPPKAGMYEFICTVAGHAAKGMRGILMVQPGAGGAQTTAPSSSPSPR